MRSQPSLLPKGWAIRPPVVRSVFSAEQKALLTEIFDRPDRLTEHAAEAEFKSRFCQRDGPFARENRLNKTQIKSWMRMSNEKARRAKQQLRSDLDDEASSGADVGGNAAVAGGRGEARG